MTSDMQNLAAANGEVCDLIPHLAGRDRSQDTIASVDAQHQLIATIRKNAREEFRVSVRNFGGVPKVDITVWQRDPKGTWRPTPRNLVIGANAIVEVSQSLAQAKERLR
jgi:hypothetical protein